MLPLHPLLQAIKRRCRTLVNAQYTNCNRLSLALLTLVAFLARLYKIGNDSRVVWDETHFGRFASNYLTHTFYLDVHPPLGKLLVTLMFWLLGYSGSFGFASGEAYPETVPFAQMRYIQAAVGSFLVPSTFYLCRSLTFSSGAAWLAAFFIAFDNAFIGISRIVVLDPMLLLANSLAVLALSRVLSANFTHPILNLSQFAYLGVSLAVVCSIKFVGLLTASVIGIYLSIQITCAFIDTKPLKKAQIIEAALVYSGTLVVLPILLHLAFFQIHFSLLQNYTPHADSMGSEYSISLNGSALRVQPAHIYNSSFVTIRATAYPFEYLRTKQYVDPTNDFSVNVRLSTTREFAVDDYLQVNLSNNNLNETSNNTITDGSVVSLQAPKTNLCISAFPLAWLATGRGLFVDFAEQNTTNPETVGYGAVATTVTTKWKIKAVHKQKQVAGSAIVRGVMPIASKFKLVSPENKNCELSISRSHAPQMTTAYSSLLAEYPLECVVGQGTVWTIEHQLPIDDKPVIDISPFVAKPSLLTNTVSYSRLMHEINGMLKSDPDQYIQVESAPSRWPFLKRPMHLVEWSDNEQPKYMLVGNLILWRISAFVCIFVHPILVGLQCIIRKRSGRCSHILPDDYWKESMLWCLWAAHYLVFFGMSRTTYLHHYLPALYFALVLTALYIQKLSSIIRDIVLASMGSSMHRRRTCSTRNIMIAFAFVVAIVSYLLAPITFGTSDPCSFKRFRFIPTIWRQLCPRE